VPALAGNETVAPPNDSSTLRQESGDTICFIPNYFIDWWNGPEPPCAPPPAKAHRAANVQTPAQDGGPSPSRAALLLLNHVRDDPCMALLPPVGQIWRLLRTKHKKDT
jgi:hypothetical protein